MWGQDSSEDSENRRDSIPSMRFTFPSSGGSGSSNLQRVVFEQAVPIRVAPSFTQQQQHSWTSRDDARQFQQHERPHWSLPETEAQSRFHPTTQQSGPWPPQQQQQQQRIPIPALPVVPLSFRHHPPQTPVGQFNPFQSNNHNNRPHDQSLQQQQQQLNDELPTGWMTQQLPPRRYNGLSHDINTSNNSRDFRLDFGFQFLGVALLWLVPTSCPKCF